MYTKAHFDFDNPPEWLTLLRKTLNLEGVGLGMIYLPQGKGYTYMHSHKEQEEVYIVLHGSGLIRIREEDVELERGDFIRVAPRAKRALRASDESDMVAICAGGVVSNDYPKKPNSNATIDDGVPDFDNIPPWYEGNKKIIDINKRLKKKREKSTSLN